MRIEVLPCLQTMAGADTWHLNRLGVPLIDPRDQLSGALTERGTLQFFQQPCRCSLFFDSQGLHRGHEILGMQRKDLSQQFAAVLGDLSVGDALILLTSQARHEPTLFQFLYGVRGARSREQDPITELPKRRGTSVIQCVKD